MKKSIQDLFNNGTLKDTLGNGIYGSGPISSRPGGDFVFPFEQKFTDLAYRVAEFKFGYLSDKLLCLLRQTEQCNKTLGAFKQAVVSRDVKGIVSLANEMVEFSQYLIKIRNKVSDSLQWVSEADLKELSGERVDDLMLKIKDLEVAFLESSKALIDCTGLIQKSKSTVKFNDPTAVHFINTSILDLKNKESLLHDDIEKLLEFAKTNSNSSAKTKLASTQ